MSLLIDLCHSAVGLAALITIPNKLLFFVKLSTGLGA